MKARVNYAVLSSKRGFWLRAALACTLLLAGAEATAQASWPVIALPKGVTQFDIAQQMTANGVPLRMQGILSAVAPGQVATLFRESLGQPLVENTLGPKLVLGRAQGEFYVTVQLEPAGTGTRGLIAVTKLSSALEGRDASRTEELHVLSRFPTGSKRISQMSSVDGRNAAEHQVLINNLGVDLNVEHVKRMLSNDGYTLERETAKVSNARSRSASGTTLFFKRPGGEAIAMVYRDASERTVLVLNTIAHLEAVK